ncbi:serine/threonine-protein kinase [Mycobacterium shigaense]|uniref:serine/threonine-protein kinase n=1 Tax=Mycobacterium shigaense TaxID=722731 RepID=UPI000E57A0A3|nr:serine/threonine-protein kinase [Mycobacterium shigaense]MEA1123745.1 serine/threonine-protein kinase [Mycobacterium shigaense]
MSGAEGSRLGTTFGPYHLKRLLGRGGMGEVYEAEHTIKEWTVALKLMSRAFSQDPVFRKRMEREARITGRLLEPHVVPIHDYGEIDGQLFLEMRLIEGIDLGSLLEKEGALPAPRAVAIIHQIAAALDAAHAAGVTHRDVKPQNILITSSDFAYLVDFGIASAKTDEKLTQLGTAVGTWKYMAPERFSNGEVTARADVYALACVLYECLTGAAPYRADNTGVLITSHLMEPVPKPSASGPGIPPAFDAVIERGMAKNPDDRYESAGALAAAAHEALSNTDQHKASTILRHSDTAIRPITGAQAHAAALPTEPAPPRQRHRWPIVAAVAAVVAFAGGVGSWFLQSPSGDQSATSTVAPREKAAARSGQGTGDDESKLLSLLPSGYASGACTPAPPDPGSLWVGAVTMVTCGPNTQPGGPTRATYGLFPDLDSMKRAFDADVANLSLTDCPGEGKSPAPWQPNGASTVTGGMIACGTSSDHPSLIWTFDKKLMLSDVAGDQGAVADLHKWWEAYS